MNLTIGDVISSAAKAILWLFINMIYGLFPFLLLKYVSSLSLNQETTNASKEEITNQLRNGSILFACCVIMGAALVDLIFTRSKISKGMIFAATFFSIVPLVPVAITFITLVLDKNNTHNFNNLMSYQTLVIWYSCLFCFFTKSYLFTQEGKHHVR